MPSRWFKLALFLCCSMLACWAAAQGSATQPVQVRVVDLSGQPVPGATVVLDAPGMPERRRDTDAAGTARFELPMNGAATVNVQVSKDGFRLARDVLPWNPATGAAPARLDMTLTRTDQTLLVVTVRGPSGVLPNIPVTVEHYRAFGGGPSYQGITGADGVARIVVQTGRTLPERLTGTSFRVLARHPGSAERPDAREAVSTVVSVNYQLPSRAVDLMMIEGSSDTVSGMPVRVRVTDADGAVAGATVLLQRSGGESRSAVTDAAGEALLEASVVFASPFGIHVAKDGYLPARAGIELDPRSRGKAVPVVPVELRKDPAAQARAPVRINVTSAGAGVEAASVRLTPLGDGAALVGSTAPSGVLELNTAARGRFRLEVRHRNHETHSEEVQLDGNPASFAVALAARAGRLEDSQVDLLVTAADKKTADGKPLPLAGASVIVGRTTQPTDERGRARVAFTGQLGVNIRVEAPGYEPAVISVDGGRYSLVSQVSRSVQLEPARPTEATPFDLVIRTAEDAEPFAPIPKVSFKLLLADGSFFGGTYETDTAGERSLRVPAEQAARVRRGLTVVVAATSEHGPASTVMAHNQLEPSTEPRLHLVLLRNFFARDLAALNAQVARLEALKHEVQQRLDDAWSERDRTPSLLEAMKAQIDARFGGKLPATPFQQMQQQADQACDSAARTVRAHARDAETRSRDALRLIESAEREAAVCTGIESAARIDAVQQALLLGLADFKKLHQRARLDAQGFAQQAGNLEQEADDPLGRVRNTADQIQRAAQGAAVALADARRAAASLTQGHAEAVTALNGLRARSSLRPDQFAQTQELRRRLTPLPFDLEPPNDPARLAKADADVAAQLLRDLQARAASFGKQGCLEARSGFPRMVNSMEADLAALAFTLARADLPSLANACRERVASNSTPNGAVSAVAAPPAVSQAATVPDLGVVPRPQWPQVVQAAGLSWGGEIPLAQAAPSAGKSQAFAWQSLIPGTQVQRGVPLNVFVWGPYVPAQGDKPASTPATEAPTAVQPPSTTGPSIWERLLRGAAAATPGIVAAVQQSRGQQPGAPAPAVTPAAVPPAPPQAAGAGIGVPNVYGDSLEQAQRKLQAVGITVRGVSRGGKPPSPELSGRVYHQNPAAGTAVMRGMTADLMVYDNDRSTVTPPAPASAAATTRYDRPTQGGLPIHQCATAGSWPNGDCGSEGAQFFCVNYKGHQRVYGFKTYTVPQSFRLKDGTRCVQGLCPAFLEVVCQ